MSFTDEDLRQLKPMVLNAEAFYGIRPPISLSALIARLEAAEDIIESIKIPLEYLLRERSTLSYPENVAPYETAIQKWRKAAGK